MKHIIIECDGARSVLVKNAFANHDYCTREECSLYSFCLRAPVTPCAIVSPNGYHFEAESHSPQENESVRM